MQLRRRCFIRSSNGTTLIAFIIISQRHRKFILIAIIIGTNLAIYIHDNRLAANGTHVFHTFGIGRTRDNDGRWFQEICFNAELVAINYCAPTFFCITKSGEC